MRDLIVLVVLLAFILPGLTRPYLAFAGYLWVDTVVPQGQVFGFLANQPISMVMAIVCLVSLILGVRKLSSTESKFVPFLFVFFIIWITVSSIYSEFPIFAWNKWDTAVKTLIMAFLLMFTITTRKQLELVILILFCSLMFYMASAGPKSLLSGGGYGVSLILGGSNAGLAESSTLACVAVMTLPIIGYLQKHTTLLPARIAKNRAVWVATSILCLATVIGSTARTGLVVLVAYVGIKSLRFRSLIKIVPLALFAAFTIYQFAPESWFERMATTGDVANQSVSSDRIAVWLWTLDYVAERPLIGGGFNSYLANGGLLGLYDERLIDYQGVRAFHSIYFEVLGEHGYVGLSIFIALISSTILVNRSLLKRKDIDERTKDFCLTMNHTIILFCIGGFFIGIAFKPILYQLIAISIAHHTITYKELNEQITPEKEL